MTTRTTASVIFLAALISVANAQSAAVYKKFKGQIIVSDAPIEIVGNDNAVTKSLKKAQKSELRGSEGTWSFHFMAFLAKKPTQGQLTVAFYTDAGGRRTMATYKDVEADTGSDVLTMPFEIHEDDGINPGTKYELALVDLSSGQEVVFAKTKLTLK